MMELKNDCERDYIKEAFDNLYNCVMPFIDLTQFADADAAFKELDKKVHSEIYILKKCLSERDRAVDAGLTRSEVLQERIRDLENNLTDANQYKDIYRNSSNSLRSAMFERYDELRKANNKIDELKNDLKMAEARIEAQKKTLDEERKHGEDLADVNGKLASENADLKAKTSQLILLQASRTCWRSRAQHAEKEVEELNKNISKLEKELAESRNSNELLLRKENDRLRIIIDGLEKENADDATRIESLKKANSALRRNNGILWAKMEELETGKRPWHGDGNAITGVRTCCESLAEAIEFQNKKIEELEAEKVRLKEAYDIQETTIKKENVDLSPGHEFKFGDEVFVPWSDGPYMYVKRGLMYNPRTERLVYVGKDQHLKLFGEKFSIV